MLRTVMDPCERCGRAVSAPVRLTDLSHKPTEETYYACPFCLSRLNIEDVSEHLEHSHGHERGRGLIGGQMAASASTPVEVPSFKLPQDEKCSDMKKSGSAESAGCSHQFGYLRNRPKDTDIPDECLTCPKILQCMARLP